MKAALTVWNGRIAPVFDVARQAIVVTLKEQDIFDKKTIALPQGPFVQKIEQLVASNVSIIICGAMSRSAYFYAQSHGLQIYAFIAGEIDEVLDAWRDNRLLHEKFAMPGCGRRNHRCVRKGRGRNRRHGRYQD